MRERLNKLKTLDDSKLHSTLQISRGYLELLMRCLNIRYVTFLFIFPNMSRKEKEMKLKLDLTLQNKHLRISTTRMNA